MGDRAAVLAHLEAEARQAEGCFEYRRAAELRAQITQLSAGTPQPPAKETTTRRTAARKSRN
jgi:excinuclease UvrABC nuclease subunit